MAIVPLVKMTLYGAETQKPQVLEHLQEMGCAHIVNLGRSDEVNTPDDDSTDAREAFRYLRACPESLRQVRRMDQFQRDAVVAEALRLRAEQRELVDERDELQKAIRDVEPWGEFQLPSEGRVGDVRFWFRVVPVRDLSKFRAITTPWKEVNHDNQNAYVVVISQDEPPDLPGMSVQFSDPRPLSKLRARLEHVDERLEELQYQRVGLTRWCDLLKAGLDEAHDAAERTRAEHLLLNGRSVFAIQGWVPRDATDRILQFAADNGLAATIEPPAPDDEPPTLLHNPEGLAGSEALVTFYKTPQYGSWDPSIISFVSFAIFFAMIVADAGYGIVLALLTAFVWKSLGRTQSGRRGRNLLAAIDFCTIGYGMLCGSYFGVAPPAHSLLGKVTLLDAQSQSQMMPLTIVIGVIHLALAQLIMAWQQRGQATAIASLGWVSVMAGATMAGLGESFFSNEQHVAQLSETGLILLVAGTLAVFLFSSKRPLRSRSLSNHAMRLLDGIKELTNRKKNS